MLRNSLVLFSLASLTAVAHAQGGAASGAPADPAAEPAAAEPATTAALAPTPAPAPESMQPSSAKGLRNGFSLSVGEEFGTTMAGQDFSGQLYGVDWRIGARFSDAISVYLHSHISFGTVAPNSGAGGGVTGNLAAAVVGEYKLPMGVFVGAGAGYGVLNNPNGPLIEARAGYYPFKSKAAGKSRRLNVALDSRWYMVDEADGPVTQISLSLGYDRY